MRLTHPVPSVAPVEDRQHVLLYCNAYAQEREEALTRMLPYLSNLERDMPEKNWIAPPWQLME